jgi:hypothetical protein
MAIRPWFIACLLALFWTGFGISDARSEGSAQKIKLATAPPAFSANTCATVSKGGAVSITLHAIPSYGSLLTFELTRMPLHGTLGKVRNISDHEAVVTYIHDGSRSPLADEFSFRVRAAGRAPSVPSRVAIRIVQHPAVIVFKPDSIDFGGVILSESSTTNVTITNIGGSSATGRLVFPRGVTASGGDSFSLDEAESAVIPIQFTPYEQGVFTGEVRTLPTIQKSPLHIKGKGLARFSIIKKSDAGLLVRNLSTNCISINISERTGRQIVKEMKIPPLQEAVVDYQQLASSQSGDLRNDSNKFPTMLISDGISMEEVEVPEPHLPDPLIVRRITCEELGNAVPGSRVLVSFSVKNPDKHPRSFCWKSTSESGGSQEAMQYGELQPDEERTITADWSPSLPGNFLLRIEVKEEGMPIQQLVWRVRMLSESPRPNEVPSNHAPEIAPEITPEIATDSETSSPVVPQPIPSLEGVQWKVMKSMFGKQSLLVSWNNPEAKPMKVMLGEMKVVEAKGSFEKSPSKKSGTPDVHLEGVLLSDYRVERGKAGDFVVVSGLSPGWHLLRLILLPMDGSIPKACSQLQVMIPPSVPWWDWLRAPLGLLAIVLLILFFWRVRRAG